MTYIVVLGPGESVADYFLDMKKICAKVNPQMMDMARQTFIRGLTEPYKHVVTISSNIGMDELLEWLHQQEKELTQKWPGKATPW